MGGLLYKDFVAVNRIGKVKVTWFFTILTLVFIVLRVAFPGTSNDVDFLVTNEAGDQTIHSFFLLFQLLFLFYIVL